MDSCFVVFNTLISNNCQICIFSRPGSPIHIHGHWLSDKVTGATILVNGEHVQGSSVVQCPLVVHFRLHALVQKLCGAPSAGVLWTQLEGIVPNWIWEGGGGGGAPPKESLFNPVHSCLLLSTQQISWTKELFSLSLHFHIWHILESASYVIRFPSQQGQLSKNRLGQARAECPSLDICGRELTCLFSCRSLQCLM